MDAVEGGGGVELYCSLEGEDRGPVLYGVRRTACRIFLELLDLSPRADRWQRVPFGMPEESDSKLHCE